MEIIVCIKQVPGTTQVEVDEQTGVLKRDGVASKMNPYDLYAIETAVRLKSEYGGSIHSISMGPPQASRVIKESYMMGVDKGTLLSDRSFAGADVLATAYTLSQGIKRIDIPDVIICGKMTTDGDTAQVGPEIAEFLSIPHVTNVTEIIKVTDEDITLKVDMPNTVEILKVSFPCLITVEKNIFQPRLPSYRLKLDSKDRLVDIITLKDLEDVDESRYGLNGSPTQVKKIFNPEGNDTHEIWEGDDENLTNRLYNKLSELRFI